MGTSLFCWYTVITWSSSCWRCFNTKGSWFPPLFQYKVLELEWFTCIENFGKKNEKLKQWWFLTIIKLYCKKVMKTLCFVTAWNSWINLQKASGNSHHHPCSFLLGDLPCPHFYSQSLKSYILLRDRIVCAVHIKMEKNKDHRIFL